MAYTGYLDVLQDVDAPAPSLGDVLRFDGTSWVNAVADYKTVSAIKTAAYSPGVEEIVRVDPSAGGFTITLPATHSAGSSVTVKNVTTNNTNSVLIDPADADTIDGSASYDLKGKYAAVEFMSDGTNWMAL